MTSAKQVQANRRNAQKSTGPKTKEGKDIASLNATKHGLPSQEVLLPGEDEAALKELGERLRTELQPAGELESLLVDRIIASYWRLRRLGRVEAGIFAWELYGELVERAQQEASIYELSGHDRWRHQTTTITDDKKHQKALSKPRRYRPSKKTHKPPRSAGPLSEIPTKRTPSPSSPATRWP
jgi:hypothetical protein